MLRFMLCSSFCLSFGMNASAQVIIHNSLNPASISSSAPSFRNPAVAVPPLVQPGFNPGPIRGFGGGYLLPFSVYGFDYYGYGGYVNPYYFPPARGGYLNRESSSFDPPQDNLAATMPGVAYPTSVGRNISAPRDLSPEPDFARFTLQVPDEAEVYLEGQVMKGSGPVRNFVSPKLKSGVDYLYEVKVIWKQNGKSVQQTRLPS